MSLDLLPDGEFEELKNRLALARNRRTYAALAKIDPHLASSVVDAAKILSGNSGTLVERSAITIQRIARGFVHRKIYADILFEKFEKEERERERLKQLQVEEGEALLRTVVIKQRMRDEKLVWKNRCAVNNHKATLIQRYYRKWRESSRVQRGGGDNTSQGRQEHVKASVFDLSSSDNSSFDRDQGHESNRSAKTVAETVLHNIHREMMAEKYSCSPVALRALPMRELRARHQMLQAELDEQNRLLRKELQKKDELAEEKGYLRLLSIDLIERIGPGYVDVKTGKHKKGYKRPKTNASSRDKFDILM